MSEVNVAFRLQFWWYLHEGIIYSCATEREQLERFRQKLHIDKRDDSDRDRIVFADVLKERVDELRIPAYSSEGSLIAFQNEYGKTYVLKREMKIADEVREIPDLNPGIVETVYWLRSLGFNTCDSGDGKTHLMEGDRDYTNVSIRISPDRIVVESHRLREMLLLRLGPKALEPPQPFDGTIPDLPPTIQASYDPENQIAILDLLYADDYTLGFKKK